MKLNTIIVTGSAGLIGSETVKHFAKEGRRVVGIDNDMRSRFFGAEASTRGTRDELVQTISDYEHHNIDIRDAAAVLEVSSATRARLPQSCIPPRNRHTIGRRAIRRWTSR
jgi:CDP-paratose 2-epimerase